MTQQLTLLAVHAHPDDESSSTGGVLARYAREGVRTVVVTCTNGEFGDGPDHVKPGEAGHDPAEVARVRSGELEAACAILGVGALERLGYHDSGMADWPYRERPEAFCNVPLVESVGRLAALFERHRPDIVITYNDDGGYDHPDHVQAHRVTTAAVEATGLAAKLYFTARRREDWARMRERLRALGADIPEPPAFDEARLARIRRAEERISTEVDVSAYALVKRAALAAHVSQLDESWWTRFPADTFEELFGREMFIRHLDHTGALVPEDDLLAGLR